MEIIKRCKACGFPLDDQGICSKPCKLGKLQKQIASEKDPYLHPDEDVSDEETTKSEVEERERDKK